MTRLQICQFAAASILVLGCGGGLNVERLTGEARFAGQPIVYGQIEFIPLAQRSEDNPTGVAEIIDGRFDTADAGGKGVLWGKHKIRVTAYASRPAGSNEDETVSSEAADPICLGYPLEMDIQENELAIEVPESARGFNMFDQQRQAGGANEP